MRPGRANPLAALGLLLAAGGFFGGPGRRAPGVLGAAAGLEAREASRSAPQPGAVALTPDQADARKRWLDVRATRPSRGPKRDGWSVAQDRRNARKTRNVSRNRAAHR